MLIWVANRLGSGIYITNIVCASVMMYGMARFAWRQPDPWMAVTAAVPYLVIVVGMGYTRQAAAIGFILLAILAFEDKRVYLFTGLMLAAAAFHGSSLCVLPFAVVALARQNKTLILPFLLLAVVLYVFLLSRRADDLYHLYVTREQSMDSSGALVRLVMNAVPATVFLLYRRWFGLDQQSDTLWTLFSVAAIALLGVLYVFPSSTAIDRIGLYFIPIQLFVFGRLPGVVGQTPAGARIVSYVVIVYYAAVLFTWLTFASHANDWLPYRFAPLN